MSHEAHTHHISSPALLWATFAALVGLTLLTVAMAQLPLDGIETAWVEPYSPIELPDPLDVSWLDMPITLTIATAKALLVAVIFMHLQHDKLINSVILIASVVFLVLFIGMVVLDSNQYEPQIEEYLYEQEVMANP